MALFTIESEKCKRDYICVEECPARLFDVRGPGETPTPVAKAEEYCIDCCHCVAVCPHGALSFKQTGPDELAPIDPDLVIGPEQAAQFLKTRRSIRAFKDRPVDNQRLAELIEIARHAPTGSNTQPVEYIVFTDPADIRKMAGMVVDWLAWMVKEEPEFAATMNYDRLIEAWRGGLDRVMRSAPNLIVAQAEKEHRAAASSSIIALTYLELAAFSMGLGACWAGYFMAASNAYPPLIEFLKLKPGRGVFGAMMLGYPKYKYHRIPIRNEADITWR